MKKLALSLLAAICCGATIAQDQSTTDDKLIITSDEVFMDMAVTATQTAISRGLKPCGAVVIDNGAWRSTGMALNDDITAEENAIDKSHRTSLAGAVIYTINHPTTAALKAISESGVERVYFIYDIDDVISAGVYPKQAFDAIDSDSTLTITHLIQMDYAPANGLLKAH